MQHGSQHSVPLHRPLMSAASDDADSTAQTFLYSLRDVPPSQARRCSWWLKHCTASFVGPSSQMLAHVPCQES